MDVGLLATTGFVRVELMLLEEDEEEIDRLERVERRLELPDRGVLTQSSR